MRFDVEVEQARAFAGKPVDARGGSAAEDAAAVDAQFAVAEIVREHKDNIRLLSCRLGRSLPATEHERSSHRAQSKAPNQESVRRHC